MFDDAGLGARHPAGSKASSLQALQPLSVTEVAGRTKWAGAKTINPAPVRP